MEDEDLIGLCNEIREDLAAMKVALTYMLENSRKAVWMNSYQVQNHLNISRFTLRRYRETGQIRSISFRGRYRYLNKDVEKLKYIDTNS